jgi:hypothetical protein
LLALKYPQLRLRCGDLPAELANSGGEGLLGLLGGGDLVVAGVVRRRSEVR